MTVDSYAGKQGRRTMWNCTCECGNKIVARGENLKNGNTKSCGCYGREKTIERLTTHGMTKTRLYKIYQGIKSRCYRGTNSEFFLYGARGIKMCDEWKDDFESFSKWANENGYIEDAKQKDCSIDRIDVNGDYSPENCRWVNSFVQANNTRKNKYYEWNGETHTLTEWSRILHINSGTIYTRINKLGWTVEEAFTLPVSPISQRK